jgi:membrane protease YdiL (CAAX protease family)
MGTIASLLARTGAAVEQFDAKRHWLRYILLLGLLFVRFGYELIGMVAFIISTYILALLYFWTIPKQERQLYNFTVPKKNLIAIAFAVGIICLAVQLPISLYIDSDLIKLKNSFFVVEFLGAFVIQFSLFALPEEMLFRGILWGEGRRIHLSDFSILCIQAILFWGGHYYYYDHPYWWIRVLVAGLIFGIVAWKTKSVLASAIVHALLNSQGDGGIIKWIGPS